MPIVEILSTLNALQGLDDAGGAGRRSARKSSTTRSCLELKAVPEVLEHIHDKHGHIPSIVSGSTRESVTASLKTLGILDRFDTLVCAGDYKKAKPDPEPCLLAAQRLGVDPQDCLVFEVTDMGIASATAAGMQSVKVPHPRERALISK